MPRIARVVIPHYSHHVTQRATVAKEFSLMMKIMFSIKNLRKRKPRPKRKM